MAKQLTLQDFSAEVLKAAQEYINRRDRVSHPEGTFDRAGRFYLSEACDCDGVREPSRHYPYSQMVHGRSAKHVASIFHVPAVELRRAAKLLDAIKEAELSKV